MAVDRSMTIIEHLEELRRRLLIAIVALLAATAISWFFADQLLTFFIRPVGRVISWGIRRDRTGAEMRSPGAAVPISQGRALAARPAARSGGR